MTEDEWFMTQDVGGMLKWLRTARRVPKVSTRKLQHFMQAVAASVPELLAMPEAVQVLRMCADAADSGELLTISPEEKERLLIQLPTGWAVMLCRCLLGICNARRYEYRLPEDNAEAVVYYARPRVGETAAREYARLLRDIVGNPFRPVAFAPGWRTSTAVALAKGMYDSRDFGAMPILADALQDAGCDSEDILSHCRDANATHVRGCWVVDLVLGKS